MINKIKQWVSLVWTYITNNENYDVVKAVYKIANEVANKTKTDIDNAALAFIATAFRYETKSLSFRDIKEVSNIINNLNKGPLDSFEVLVNKDNIITIKSPIGSVIYDYSKGNLRWSNSKK